MDRRLLFPIAAVTAWAQQPSPEAAAAQQATEAALRARAEEFFNLQVAKKYRQAEALVADDSKDEYYNDNKFSITSFKIDRIELLPDNTKAKVTIKARVKVILAGAGQILDVEAPRTTDWQLENGTWVYHVDSGPDVATPFGKIHNEAEKGPPAIDKTGQAPAIATLQDQVSVDRDSVNLTTDAPEQTVIVSNNFAGAVELSLTGDHLDGFSVEIEKKQVEPGEKARVLFRAEAGTKPKPQVVHIIASPLNRELDIGVNR